MLLMIDNYDSFTYNLVQYFGELKQNVKVVRNDEMGVEALADLNPDYLVISPGPCTPAEAGISVEAIQHFAGKIPILGVCLGHQSIAHAFGGEVIHAKQLMHGKMSSIHHQQKGLFKDLPTPFIATRYHSLSVNDENLPDCFEVTARTEDDEIMGIQHTDMMIHGLQFHPESLMTEHGHDLLKNFLQSKQ